jgi:hypothetical protein
MGKGVLQRLAGYLRDLWISWEANPHAWGGGTDRKSARLVAIDGSKGISGWDGVERRKPRAVIGIPYSSDAAENTEMAGEEKTMKRIGMYLFTTVAVAAAAFLIAACGGGGGGTTSSAGGTTGTAVATTGTMEKVNSVKVNGVTFSAGTAAKIRVEDNGVVVEVDATQANEDRLLRSGMQVKVKGQIDDRAAGKGQFAKVEAEPEVRGRIEVGSKGADDFRVNGQHVIVDDNTVFEDRVTGGTNPTFDNTLKFSGILETERVEVHGGLDDFGRVRASRVERRESENLLDELTGTVTGFTGTSFTLVTGGANIPVVLATGAVVTPSGSAIANNAPVEVYGSYSAGTFTANRVHIEDREDAEFEPAEGQEAEVEGFVGGFTTGGTTFHVGSVDITLKATTIFVNGSLADLVNGSKVEVEGHKKGTAIEADKVKFKNTRIILSGPASVNPPPTLLGKTLRYTSATRNTWSGPGSGKNPEARGYDDGTGKVIVEELRDASGGGNKDIVQARVTSKTSTSILLFGFTADLSGINPSQNKLTDNKGKTYTTLADFLAAITPASATAPGTLVKVKGTNGAPFAAEEAEIEFEN